MRFVLFYHSLLSDWNHGNAHFLRGVASELLDRGHEVAVYEPAGGWSLGHLRAEQGEAPIAEFHAAYPRLGSVLYDLERLDLDAALDGADVVLVHEWNAPRLIEAVGRYRAAGHAFRLLFHDTHHRAVSDPQALAAADLSGYDGVLAFGAALRELYERRGWARSAWTWHEGADTRIFRPYPAETAWDVVWVGNWGDGEREREILEFLVEPLRALRLRARLHGVRYPARALAQLAAAGIEYGGWLANFQVPALLAAATATVHVPRRFYRDQLPGIPTIRVFEALACRIPLVSAPWSDAESLFGEGDFLVARSGGEMQRHLRALVAERGFAQAVAERGHRTVLARHTCAHRVEELLAICRQLAAQPRAAA